MTARPRSDALAGLWVGVMLALWVLLGAGR